MFTENPNQQNNKDISNNQVEAQTSSELTPEQQQALEAVQNLSPQQSKEFLENLVIKQGLVGTGDAQFATEPKPEEAVEATKDKSKNKLVNKWTIGGASATAVGTLATFFALTFGSGTPETVKVNADGEGPKTENVESSKKDILDSEELTNLQANLKENIELKLSDTFKSPSQDMINKKDQVLGVLDKSVSVSVEQADKQIKEQGLGGFRASYNKQMNKLRNSYTQNIQKGEAEKAYFDLIQLEYLRTVNDYAINFHDSIS